MIKTQLRLFDIWSSPKILSLETIHHQRLHIALGIFTTSPIENLFMEANESPLSLRRYKLALQYYAKLISCPQNSVCNCINEIRYKKLLLADISNTKIPHTDLKPIKKFILKIWQKSWDDQTLNKLHCIQDTIGK